MGNKSTKMSDPVQSFIDTLTANLENAEARLERLDYRLEKLDRAILNLRKEERVISDLVEEAQDTLRHRRKHEKNKPTFKKLEEMQGRIVALECLATKLLPQAPNPRIHESRKGEDLPSTSAQPSPTPLQNVLEELSKPVTGNTNCACGEFLKCTLSCWEGEKVLQEKEGNMDLQTGLPQSNGGSNVA